MNLQTFTDDQNDPPILQYQLIDDDGVTALLGFAMAADGVNLSAWAGTPGRYPDFFTRVVVDGVNQNRFTLAAGVTLPT